MITIATIIVSTVVLTILSHWVLKTISSKKNPKEIEIVTSTPSPTAVSAVPLEQTLETEPEVKNDPPPRQLFYCTEEGEPVLEVAMLENESLTNYKKKELIQMVQKLMALANSFNVFRLF